MDVKVVLGMLGLVAAVFSTLWEAGGWSAVRRRSIQQELDLAKELPASSPTRKRLTAHVEEEIDIYLYRLGKQVPQTRRPLSFVAVTVVIVVVVAAIFPDANTFVVYGLEGLFVAAVVWAYAVFMRSWWIKRNRLRHKDMLRAARHPGDSADATRKQQVEPA